MESANEDASIVLAPVRRSPSLPLIITYPILFHDIYDPIRRRERRTRAYYKWRTADRGPAKLTSHNNMAILRPKPRSSASEALPVADRAQGPHSPLIAFLFEIFHLVHFQSKRRRSLTHTCVLTCACTCAIAEDGIPARRHRSPYAYIVVY